ncbi:putative lipid II flippase FtsW [Candidatus Shapirobacteria bacterium CG09_land_8_20_14_0_10_38_17]|uniref:Probable peptidoglycan glycosyltransferase FtsW n=1 Tax=Candidatus Shapirobacteria bacterium CG09_land_8_20_14_0_10_38_17 TaxID=1974884 RepID=A0A2H0WRC1_9BACT|nr:MAG: putative lipid II flippase FtsW [Candidatus Shapirobacteria bacterium CG09_land_8_20_14_0_10_38_17]
MLKKLMKKKHFDWLLFTLVIFLSLFGLLMIADASAVVAQRDFGDQFYYLKKQSIWLALGIVTLLGVSKINYQYFKKAAIPILVFSITTLIVVLIPGLGIKRLGAQRWLGIGTFSFQPSEIAKLALVLYGASFLANNHFKKQSPHRLWPFLIINALIASLIILEPDLGTTVTIVAIGLALCFLADVPSWKLLIFLCAALILAVTLIFSSTYRQERLLTFLKPNYDPQGASYHVHQILLALGSGGLWGQGIGQGKQKYAYLPEVTTDSIFAIIAEEFGFVGATIFVITLSLLIFRCLYLSNQTPDQFAKLLVAGVGVWLGFQALINLGSMVAILPLTGIPLPLVSYGGSSLLVTMTGLGMVLSISRERVRRKKRNDK